MKMPSLIVTYRGKKLCKLNANMVERQKLTPERIKKLKELHRERQSIFDMMEISTVKSQLRELVKDLQEVEFQMQDAWRFPRDARYHSWWYKAPKCTCPKMDNDERRGTCLSIINQLCVLHGNN